MVDYLSRRIGWHLTPIGVSGIAQPSPSRFHHRRAVDAQASELSASRDLGRTWLHVDMDAFFAAVEERDRPDLVCVLVYHGVGGEVGDGQVPPTLMALHPWLDPCWRLQPGEQPGSNRGVQYAYEQSCRGKGTPPGKCTVPSSTRCRKRSRLRWEGSA